MWKKFTQPVKIVTSTIVGFSALFFVDYVDLGGVEESAGQLARDYFNILVAPTLNPQNDSVVILIDDYFMKETKSDWPLSRAELANLIEAITEKKPKALMIGMLLMKRRSDEKNDVEVNYLRDAIYNQDRVPVYLAAIQEEKESIIEKINPDLEYNRLSDTKVDYVSVKSGSYHHRHVSIDYIDESLLKYDNDESLEKQNRKLQYRCNKEYSSEDIILPAYMKIYFDLHLCKNNNYINFQDYARPMDVFWFAGPSKYSSMMLSENSVGSVHENKEDKNIKDASCQKPWYSNRNVTGILSVIATDFQVWKSLFTGKTSYFQKTCPYVPFISAGNILFHDHQVFDNLIQDKVVFLGVSIPGVADQIVPPNSTKVSSIMLHAMAYENIVYYGKNYISSDSAYFISSGGWHVPPGRSYLNKNTVGIIHTISMIMLVITFVSFLSVARNKIEQYFRIDIIADIIIRVNNYLGKKLPFLYDNRNYNKDKVIEETSEYLIDSFVIIVSSVFSILVSLFSFFILRMTPANWIYFTISISIIYLWVHPKKNKTPKKQEK